MHQNNTATQKLKTTCLPDTIFDNKDEFGMGFLKKCSIISFIPTPFKLIPKAIFFDPSVFSKMNPSRSTRLDEPKRTGVPVTLW